MEENLEARQETNMEACVEADLEASLGGNEKSDLERYSSSCMETGQF